MALVKDDLGYINDSQLNNSVIEGFLFLNDVKIQVNKIDNIRVYCARK